jgi:hypothetical protein
LELLVTDAGVMCSPAFIITVRDYDLRVDFVNLTWTSSVLLRQERKCMALRYSIWAPSSSFPFQQVCSLLP